MAEEATDARRFGIAKRIYWRPVVGVAAVLYGFVQLLQFLANNFASNAVVEKLKLGDYVPDWSAAVWVAVGFGLLFAFGFEGAVREIRKADARVDMHADPLTCEVVHRRIAVVRPTLAVTNHRERDEFRITSQIEGEDRPHAVKWDWGSDASVEQVLFHEQTIHLPLWHLFDGRSLESSAVLYFHGTNLREGHREVLHVRQANLGVWEVRLDDDEWPPYDARWRDDAEALVVQLTDAAAQLGALDETNAKAAISVMQQAETTMLSGHVVGVEFAGRWHAVDKQIPIQNVPSTGPGAEAGLRRQAEGWAQRLPLYRDHVREWLHELRAEIARVERAGVS